MGTNINYDPKTALFLAKITALAYVQFQNSLNDPNFDGTITPPSGYRQIAVLSAPEPGFKHKYKPDCKANHFHLSAFNPEKIILTDIEALEEMVKDVKKVFLGFALESTEGSENCIIALRGSKDPYEWLMDATFVQAPVSLFESKELKLTKAHFGFLFIYAFLQKQITTVVRQFANPKNFYVTGHSLGGALAILTALGLSTSDCFTSGATKVQMYNYASPRVGDSLFVDIYNSLVPNSYRVVNLADVVPLIPPREIFRYQYQHIGGPGHEWSYVDQTGSIIENHSLQNNYIPALDKGWAICSKQVGSSSKEIASSSKN